MNFSAGLRDRRPIFAPTHYSIANYCTETKNDMRTAFREDLFQNLHLIPDPLKKNLADTLITEENMMSKNEFMRNMDVKTNETPPNRTEYSPLAGIGNFLSGVFNVISGAVFSKRKPSEYVSADDGQMAVPSMWQSAKSGDENKTAVIENRSSDAPGALPVDDMADCRSAVAHCQNKLHQVRLLLSQPVPCSSRLRRRPKKVFVEPNSVEDNFEDAFSPEDFENLPNDSYLEYVSPVHNQSYDIIEIDAPETKVEVGIEKTDIVKILPEVKTNNEITPTVFTHKKEELVASCEDKLSKLKALLQERRNKPKIVEPELIAEVKPAKPIKPVNKVKDKKYKNPHRTTDKRKGTKMRKSIQDDLVFANEVYMEDLSSIENSPLTKNFETYIAPQQQSPCHDYFDEVSGRFHSASLTDSEDYEVVFNDSPKRVRRPSDCDSEDSFIVFEDSPDVYTSNDVFEDSSDSDSCDSDYSDSGCGTYMSKLSHSLSKSVSNLTDDSLYANVSEDEVDCSRVENLSICETLPAVDEPSLGLLLDSKKKEKRKNQPPKSVRFSEEPPKVHVLRVWAFAARQARAGHWERYAIDRERFKRRIADVDVAVSWVLRPQHRSRVMFQRFMPWWNAQKRKELAEKKQKEEEEKARREKETEGTVDAADLDLAKDVGNNGLDTYGTRQMAEELRADTKSEKNKDNAQGVPDNVKKLNSMNNTIGNKQGTVNLESTEKLVKEDEEDSAKGQKEMRVDQVKSPKIADVTDSKPIVECVHTESAMTDNKLELNRERDGKNVTVEVTDGKDQLKLKHQESMMLIPRRISGEESVVAKLAKTSAEENDLETTDGEKNRGMETNPEKPALLKHQDSMRIITKRMENDKIAIRNDGNTNEKVNDRVTIDKEIIAGNNDEVPRQYLSDNKVDIESDFEKDLNDCSSKLVNGKTENQTVVKQNKNLKIDCSYIGHIVKDT